MIKLLNFLYMASIAMEKQTTNHLFKGFPLAQNRICNRMQTTTIESMNFPAFKVA